MKFLDIADNEVVELAATGDMPEAVHQFEPRQIRAINAALAARRPLLVRGEPGIGKSQLARAAAKGLGRAFVPHTVDARTESRDLLWHFDAVARLAEAQLLGALGRAADCASPDPAPSSAEQGDQPAALNLRDRLAIARFLHPRALWWAFDWNGALNRAKDIGISAPPQPDSGDPANGCLVLIDEIDKADIEFPNDLLLELDRMEFHVYETGETVKAARRPIVVITSNNEKELPDAFLRRCFFHYIKFPDEATMQKIVEVHYPGIKRELVGNAMNIFFGIREAPGLKKKPSTSELLDWLKLLVSEDIAPEMLKERDQRKLLPILHGALLKNEQDVSLFEKLAFLSRRER